MALNMQIKWPGSDIPVTETQTDTEMIDISKTHTETNTEMILRTGISLLPGQLRFITYIWRDVSSFLTAYQHIKAISCHRGCYGSKNEYK